VHLEKRHECLSEVIVINAPSMRTWLRWKKRSRVVKL